MKKHKISWLNIPGYIPQTWNPIVGCSKVSPGCDNCYAERWACRLAEMSLMREKYAPVVEDGKWNGKTRLDFAALNQMYSWKTPRAIFVCSMSDLFHENNTFDMIREVWEGMCINPQHQFIVLTKRPANAVKFLRQFGEIVKQAGMDSIPSGSTDPLDYISVPDHIWMGVTTENQEQADSRIPILLTIPAKVRFVSCEPLIGPVDLMKYLVPGADGLPEEMKKHHDWIDWVIAGGESGPDARPVHPAWMSSIQQQCLMAAIPFFFKQWGEWGTSWRTFNKTQVFKFYSSYLQFTQKLWVHEGDTCIDSLGKICKCGGDMQNAAYPVAIMQRVGLRKAGRQLDGFEYNEFPTIK